MKNKIAYIFILPALIFFLLFTIWPMVKLGQLSLFRTNFIKSQFVWFDNFIRLLRDDDFKGAIINTCLYVIIIVPCRISLALFISLLVFDLKKWMKEIVKFSFYVPVFAAGIIVSNVYKWIFHPTTKGLINRCLEEFEMSNIIFFSDRLTSIIPISIIMVTSLLGFDIIIYLTAMLSINKDILEAARIDGCNRWQVKTKIVFPQLIPVVFLTSLLSMIGIFQIFEYIFLLAPFSHSFSLMYDIYNSGFVYNNNGIAAAKSIVLILIIFIVSYLKRKVEGKIDR